MLLVDALYSGEPCPAFAELLHQIIFGSSNDQASVRVPVHSPALPYHACLHMGLTLMVVCSP